MLTAADLLVKLECDHIDHATTPPDRAVARTLTRLLLTGHHDQALELAFHYYISEPTLNEKFPPRAGDIGEEQEEWEILPVPQEVPVTTPAEPATPAPAEPVPA